MAGAIFASCGGGDGSSSAVPVASPAQAITANGASAAGPQALPVAAVDYFTSLPIAGANVSIDGSAVTQIAGGYGRTLPNGVHALAVTAAGYATYNGAVQIPGGATSRTVKLFPAGPSMSAWLAQINADRAANGANPVQLDDMLTIAAYDHAVDMAAQRYFAHFDPLGYSPNTRSLLLGSMMQGLENIAAGYAGWSDAEAAMMAEKSALPHQTAADCRTASEALAGHYCNVVWPAHNWVGLAIVAAPKSATQYGTYYDQEFGELYGIFDTTVLSAEPAAPPTGELVFAGVNGSTLTNGSIATLPVPVPIPIATLNADPRCLTSCPAADRWYPSSGTATFSASSWLLTGTLETSQLYFPQLNTNVGGLFTGVAIDAAVWPGGTVLPSSYTSSTWNVTTSAARSPASEAPGALVPNGAEMRGGGAR